MIPNPFKRPAPHKQPLFTPSTLKLSEKVHWLARRGLIDPWPMSSAMCAGTGARSMRPPAKRTTAIQQDNLMISQFRITPDLALIVKTSEDHQTTVVQLPEERDLI